MLSFLGGNGFLNGDWRDLIEIIGLAVAVIAFPAAALSARAAASAARAARDTVAKNIQLLEIGNAAATIREILAYTDAGSLQAANLRLADLRALVVQIREAVGQGPGVQRSFQSHLTRLTFISEELLAGMHDGSRDVSQAQIHEHLRELGDFLSSLSAKLRFRTGGSDASSQ